MAIGRRLPDHDESTQAAQNRRGDVRPAIGAPAQRRQDSDRRPAPVGGEGHCHSRAQALRKILQLDLTSQFARGQRLHQASSKSCADWRLDWRASCFSPLQPDFPIARLPIQADQTKSRQRSVLGAVGHQLMEHHGETDRRLAVDLQLGSHELDAVQLRSQGRSRELAYGSGGPVGASNEVVSL